MPGLPIVVTRQDLDGHVGPWRTETHREKDPALLLGNRSNDCTSLFDRHDLHAFLVRPDHGTFGVARTPEQVAPLVDALGARLGRS